MIIENEVRNAHVGDFGGTPDGSPSSHLHLNLGDVCPPGYPLAEILSQPRGRAKRLAAWEAAVRTWAKGIPAAIGARQGVPLTTASIEAEKIAPTPHDRGMVAEADSISAYGANLRKALGVISSMLGVTVTPYGASQILPAHIHSRVEQHRAQVMDWHDWHRPGGGLRGVTPCQSFYVGAEQHPTDVVCWVQGALDRHAAVGHGSLKAPLTVFVSPELQRAAGSGVADDFPELEPAVLATVLKFIEAHPLPCRVVSWFKASTEARAENARRIVREAIVRLTPSLHRGGWEKPIPSGQGGLA